VTTDLKQCNGPTGKVMVRSTASFMRFDNLEPSDHHVNPTSVTRPTRSPTNNTIMRQRGIATSRYRWA
jgi:hypothetical protein